MANEENTTPTQPESEARTAASNPVETGTSAGTSANDISLTSADLAKRLDRAKKAAVNDLLKELGIESLDLLRGRLIPAPAANPEVVETPALLEMREQLEKLKAANEAAEQREIKAEAARREQLLSNTLLKWTKDGQLPDDLATDILGWAKLQGRDLSALFDDAGKVNTDELRKLTNEVRAARPGWFRTAGVGSVSNLGGVPEDLHKQAQTDALASYRQQFKSGW